MLAGVVATGHAGVEEKVVIPAEWARKFEPGSVTYLSKEGAVVTCRAKLKSNPDRAPGHRVIFVNLDSALLAKHARRVVCCAFSEV